MTYSGENPRAPAVQARAWIVLLHSERATKEDVEAFARWRQEDCANEAAYRDALKLWKMLGPALARSEIQASEAIPAPVIAQASHSGGLSRRQILGGAGIVLAGTAAAMLGVPSLPANATVLQTGKGERHSETLGAGLAVELNTDTELVVWHEDAASKIRLVRGEVLISVEGRATRPIQATADDTDVFAGDAEFLLRYLSGKSPSVTCVNGSVGVESDGRHFTLRASQLLEQGANVSSAEQGKVRDALEWRNGSINFTGKPAGEVVAELNRYRPGRIYLPDSYAEVRLSGVIHVRRADLAVDHLAKSLGLEATRLPGGIVILSD